MDTTVTEGGAFDLTNLRSEVLRATAHLARLVFNSYAVSVFLHRAVDSTLVLEATSEPDADRLLGLAIPDHVGIAGWVFQTGQPMAVDDVGESAEFDHATAAATGYIPRSILAVPLETGASIVGTLEILDAAPSVSRGLVDAEIASEIARQCSAGLAIVTRITGAHSAATSAIDRVIADAAEGNPRSRQVLDAMESMAAATLVA